MKMRTIKKAIGMRAVLGSIVLAAGIFLSACGAEAKGVARAGSFSAKEAAECAMGSMKTLDLERFNACTDNYIQTEYNWLGAPVRSEYRMFNELLQPGIKFGKARSKYEFHQELYEKMLENLAWEVKSVEEDGNQAKITMEITNIDMNGVMGAYEMDILENMLAGEGSGLGQMLKDFSQIFDEKGGLIAIINEYDKSKTCTFEVTATAYSEDGAWILHLDEDLLSACMGNINAEEYSEEMQQQIKELERMQDEKLDEWEEQFSEGVEKWADGLFGE